MSDSRGLVLIVEDAPALAERHAEYLKSDNGSVEILGNDKLALGAITVLPPDVLVLDVSLPDMRGIDPLRELRSRGLPRGDGARPLLQLHRPVDGHVIDLSHPAGRSREQGDGVRDRRERNRQGTVRRRPA
jgi:CheY-like chemotaxis protein